MPVLVLHNWWRQIHMFLDILEFRVEEVSQLSNYFSLNCARIFAKQNIPMFFKGFCDKTYISDLGISWFKASSAQHNNLGQNPKVTVITLLSRLAKVVDVYHLFMKTALKNLNISGFLLLLQSEDQVKVEKFNSDFSNKICVSCLKLSKMCSPSLFKLFLKLLLNMLEIWTFMA